MFIATTLIFVHVYASTVQVIKIEPHFIAIYSVNMQLREPSSHIRLRNCLCNLFLWHFHFYLIWYSDGTQKTDMLIWHPSCIMLGNWKQWYSTLRNCQIRGKTIDAVLPYLLHTHTCTYTWANPSCFIHIQEHSLLASYMSCTINFQI